MTPKTTLTPLQAIKKYCKSECSLGDMASWKDCTIKTCHLWGYRLGHKPPKKHARMVIIQPKWHLAANKPNIINTNEKEVKS